MSPTQDGHARPAGGLQHSSFGDGDTRTRGAGGHSTLPLPCAVAEEVGRFFERYARSPGGFEFCEPLHEADRA